VIRIRAIEREKLLQAPFHASMEGMNLERLQNITIELAAASDRSAIIAGIADLQEVERTITDTRRPGAEVAEQYIDQLQRSIDQKRGAIFVARVNGKAIGFIACWIESEDNVAETSASTTYGYISDAWVAPDLRGRGVFSSLNERAEKYLARFPEVSFIRINVLADNVAAVRAYERADYEPYEVTLQKRLDRRSKS
jgi:ribosomal protein S18 acetylase RimI-like enzyme